tara:strand:+ start:243 stop:617 length:375 start_codon:yes stop_codon:yes gene_type:complete
MSTIKANTLLHSDGTTTTQPSIPALAPAMARLWVNFNGTDTVAINSAYNVSSITDNATGDYTVNFSITLSNINYAESIQASGRGTVWGARGYGTITTTSRSIRTLLNNDTPADGNQVSYIVFGN